MNIKHKHQTEGTVGMFVTYNEAFPTKMLVLKKTFSSYTSSRMPEGTVNMFIIRYLLQKCWCSRRLSQATPPVGCLKAQLTCFNSYHCKVPV